MGDRGRPEKPPWSPADVRQLLGGGIELNYQRLQHLCDFTRTLAPDTPPDSVERLKGQWRRYSAADLARMVVVISLSGGERILRADGQAGRIRGLRKIRLAAEALKQSPFGLHDPLLQVRWIRLGSDVLVLIDGVLVDPLTGQVAASFSIRMEEPMLSSMADRNPGAALLVGAQFAC